MAAAAQVLPGIVNDLIRAEFAQHLQLRRAVHGGHFRSKELGELDGKGADAAPRAVDQHLLSGLDTGLPEKVQGIPSPKGYSCRLLVGHVGRHDGYAALHLSRYFGQADILGIGAKAQAGGAKDLVAYLEAGDTLAHGLDLACQLGPHDGGSPGL